MLPKFALVARSVVQISAWPVHSGATAELTSTLFKLHSQDGATGRAESLRRTQIAWIDDLTVNNASGEAIFSYAHPIFWAPFTVVGEGGATAVGS